KVTNQDSKSLQDFRLTNAESKEIQVLASESLQTEASQAEALSDEEILKRVRENVDFCRTTWREVLWRPSQYDTILKDIAKSFNLDKVPHAGGVIYSSIHESTGHILLRDPYFIEQIENKVKENSGQKITQEEVQEAQKFLNEQMDNLMLKLYKANPKVTEDTMKREFIFHSEYSKNPRFEYEILEDYPELEYDIRLSYILEGYEARIYADKPDDEYEKFLYKAKEYLSDTEKLKDYLSGAKTLDEVDKDTLSVIQRGLAGYNLDKIGATGYEFFSALSDMLSPMEQEQIIDAIAKVMGFYLQPNSIEINGIKISWEPQTSYYSDKYDMYSISCNISFMNFEVSYPQSNLFGSVSDNLLVSLASNFNPTQSVLEILEQKDKQEQANQSLENQTSANTQTNQDLENQTLESTQAKKAYDDYKSNPLTSKASKEINDFVNEVIRKAKV
ncbi:MAG: hypothetical protein J1E31_05330, partial [Helicobacter sp.]|nr:hypothetical protein [Helicobacter sp.]